MRYSDFKLIEAPDDGSRAGQEPNRPSDNGLQAGPPYPQEDVDRVKSMQTKLEQLGYSVGNTGIDGKYGPRTTRAVAAFKKDNNISTQGNTITEPELQKLNTAEKVAEPSPTGNEGMGSGTFDYASAVPVDDLRPASANLNGRESNKATVRYNNPGGMYPAGWQSRFGGTRGGVIGGGHLIAQFPDKVSGGAAMFALLGGSMYVNKPVAEAMRKWTGGNNASTYIAWLARRGIDTGEVVGNYLANKDAAIALATNMSRWETSHAYPMSLDEWEEAYRRSGVGQ